MATLRRVLVNALKIVVAIYLLIVVAYAVPVIGGALDEAMEVKFDRPDGSLVASYTNGLSAPQAETYHHLSQGSEILPWILLTALDVPDAKSDRPFVENLTRYGLLPDPGRTDGLAIGLTLSSNPYTFGMEFVGVTCAACHVSELRYGGRAIRVHGAPNMFNMQKFYSDALEAAFALQTDRAKLWRTLKRLGRQDFQRYNVAAPFVRPALLAYSGVHLLLNWEKAKARFELVDVIRVVIEHRNKAHPTSGYGRLDAFSGTRDFLLTRLRKEDADGRFQVNTANLVKLDAPVKFPNLWSHKAQPVDEKAVYEHPEKFPRVWGFKDFDWIEWTSNTNTVMERNVAETLGAGATVVLDPAKPSALFDSSIPIANLQQLEWLTYFMDPPKWPEEILGKIDRDLAARGEPLFKAECAGCHEYGDDARTATGLLRMRGYDLKTVGTDPTAALRISCPVPDPGMVATAPRSFTAEQAELLRGCSGVTAGKAFSGNSFAAVAQAAVDAIKKKAYEKAGMTEAQQKQAEDMARRKSVLWRDTMLDAVPPQGPYAARPLYGTWAGAPYLHNGSVPTLYDLLLAPDARPRTFPLGSRRYDPVKVGFDTSAACDGEDCIVDTTTTGSGNGGHVWGTQLSASDRAALLEYLKTY